MQIKQQVVEQAKVAGDGAAAVVTGSVLFTDIVPAAAAVVTLAYAGWRLYEAIDRWRYWRKVRKDNGGSTQKPDGQRPS